MPQPSDPHEALRAALGGALPPASLASLHDDVVAELAAAIHDAHREQRRALADSGEAVMAHVPALLRRPLRKVIGL